MMASLAAGMHLLHPSVTMIDAEPALGGNVWMQVNCLDYNVDYYASYPTSMPSGSIVVLDAGPLGKFTDTNTRGITIQRGQTIRFRRTAKNTFDVISPSSGLVGRSSSFATTPRRVLLVGQSWAKQWEYMGAPCAFVDRLKELEGLAFVNTSFQHMAFGGSAALEEYSSNATDYWWDYDGNDCGPLLDAVKSTLAGMSSSAYPTHILWIQGQQDSKLYAGTTTVEGDEFQTRYKVAITKTLREIRAVLNPHSTGRYERPAFVQILGPNSLGYTEGVNRVRMAQYDAIAQMDFNIKLGAVSPDDVSLGADNHPDLHGYVTLGQLNAEAFYAAS